VRFLSTLLIAHLIGALALGVCYTAGCLFSWLAPRVGTGWAGGITLVWIFVIVIAVIHYTATRNE